MGHRRRGQVANKYTGNDFERYLNRRDISFDNTVNPWNEKFEVLKEILDVSFFQQRANAPFNFVFRGSGIDFDKLPYLRRMIKNSNKFLKNNFLGMIELRLK